VAPKTGAPGVRASGGKSAPVVGAKAAAAKAAGGLPVGFGAGLRTVSPSETIAGLRGASTELRNQMRTRRRLRLVTLLSLAAVVLVVLPAIFGLRSATRDPVFSSLDALSVPSWAASEVKDEVSGSRWCFLDCRFRERVVQSAKPFKETTEAYSAALTAAGWKPWKVAACPEQPIAATDGTYSCWTRDEFTLDLWVRQPECAVDQIAAQDPAVATAAPDPPTKACVGSTVSIKVQNAISDVRGKPAPQESPLVGETPDPIISDDPLLPTPTTS
jgi:integrin beta 3